MRLLARCPRTAAAIAAVVPDLPGTGPAAANPGTGLSFYSGKASTDGHGVVRVARVARDTDGVVRSLPQGVQALALLRGSAAPSDVAFRVDGAGLTLTPDKLGGVVVTRGSVPLGRIHAPWAVDATGRSLPTSYHVRGQTVIQHVDTASAVYPVVADPHFTFGWTGATAYFNRQETRDIAFGLGGTAAAAILLPPGFDVVVPVALGAAAAEAGVAENHGYCLYVHNTTPGVYKGSQGDGYCR